MKVSKIIFLPLFLSILVSLNGVIAMAVYLRRGLVLFILGTILWCIYVQLKEPVVSVKGAIILIIIAVLSVLIVLVTLLKAGW